MHSAVKKVLAVVVGWFCGSVVNMGLVSIGHMIFPIKGVDPADMDALAEVMPTLSSEYFIFPFFAHALGTLVGAFIAALVAREKKMRFAYIVGIIFLIGGILVNYMIPGPTWFTALDILLAYIPMAYLGGRWAINISKKRRREV